MNGLVGKNDIALNKTTVVSNSYIIWLKKQSKKCIYGSSGAYVWCREVWQPATPKAGKTPCK